MASKYGSGSVPSPSLVDAERENLTLTSDGIPEMNAVDKLSMDYVDAHSLGGSRLTSSATGPRFASFTSRYASVASEAPVSAVSISNLRSVSECGSKVVMEVGNSLDALTTECGTVPYMAPELLEHLNITKRFNYATERLVLYTKSIDVYSFGLVLWELCTEQILYEDLKDLNEIRQYVLDGKRPHIPSYILGAYAGLMKDTWRQSPLHRPSFEEVRHRLNLMLGVERNKN